MKITDYAGPAASAKLRLAAKGIAVLLAVAMLGAATARDRDDDDDDDRDGDTYAIGLWGDLPYNDVQAEIGVPNMIADMNAHRLKFTVHDGDLKAGNGIPGSMTPTICTDTLYIQAFDYLNALKAPAMFTPGDNDWTDCDRPANGGFNSLERLDFERKLFFSTPFSHGQRKLLQEVQEIGTTPCKGFVSGTPAGTTVYKDVPCVENRRWDVGGVTYVTLNVQGSCNNLCDSFPDPVEYKARNAANIAWMKEAFAHANARRSVALMIISQADPGWDLSDGTRAPLRNPRTLAQTDGQPDGYQEFLLALREQVVSFRKPVAYVNGDSHYFRVDRPFQDANGARLENFTRVETFGDNAQNGTNDVNWLKVTVDPRSREVFSYQAMIVPGNRVAVPAP